MKSLSLWIHFWCHPCLSTRFLLSLKMNHEAFWELEDQMRLKKKECIVTIWLNAVRWHVSMWSGTGLLLLAGQCTCRPGHEEDFVHEASSWQNLTCNSFQAKHGLDTSELNTTVHMLAGCRNVFTVCTNVKVQQGWENTSSSTPVSVQAVPCLLCDFVYKYKKKKNRKNKKNNLLYWNTWRMARS